MTLATTTFTTLYDAMNDRHNNTDVPLNYGHAKVPPTPPPASNKVDDVELLLFAKTIKLVDVSRLRDAVLHAGETWPPRRVWFDGFRAGHAARR